MAEAPRESVRSIKLVIGGDLYPVDLQVRCDPATGKITEEDLARAIDEWKARATAFEKMVKEQDNGQ